MKIALILPDDDYLSEDIYNLWAGELGMSLTYIRRNTAFNLSDITNFEGIILSSDINGFIDIQSIDRPIVSIGHRELPVSKYYHIWGRGEKNIRWALRYIYAVSHYQYEDIFYDIEKRNHAQLFYRDNITETPLVIVFHGGFLRPMYKLDLTMELCDSFSKLFQANLLNIEYIDSQDQVSLKKIYEKIYSLVDYLSSLKHPILICGHSAGAIPALMLGEALEKRGTNFSIMLLAPFHDYQDKYIIEDKPIHEYLTSISDISQINSLIASFKNKEFHILHGEEDDTISCNSSVALTKKLSNHNRVNLHLLDHISHMSITRRKGIYSEKLYSILQKIEIKKREICDL